MVVSGIPVATPLHASEIANMAIDLVEACTVFAIPHMPEEPLKIRVGLHTGKHFPFFFFSSSDLQKHMLRILVRIVTPHVFMVKEEKLFLFLFLLIAPIFSF